MSLYTVLSVAGLLVFGVSAACAEDSVQQQQEKEWWTTAAIYQIYPLSFRDSDNDGKGDLKGIIEKIPYLKETGFDAVWLSPIYASPMVDFGYDISNFTDIHEWYGTMADFDEMTASLHEFGIKLIMDFVPNHSSDAHEWFIRSARRDPGYEDYYVWRDPKGFDEKGRPIPPNNWLSVFYGPAWTYHQERKQFYLHQFASAQPDLNYRNPKVVEEMKEVIRFWMKKGVDGFRMDALPFLFEDPDFRDEPIALPPGKDPLHYGYLNHIYTNNRPETYDMVQQWREVIDAQGAADGRKRLMMVESYANVADTMKYFGTRERPGAHFPFNFNLMGVDNETTAGEIKLEINKWLDNIPSFGHSNWVIGNHDQHRIGSKLGEDMIDGMNAVNLLLPGTSITYYGEEIGMVDNYDITYEEGVDPQGCNYPKESFKEMSRDFERTPFQWDDSVNAGFNKGAKTWLPVNKNYKRLNLAAQKIDPYSHYALFTDLIRIRRTEAVRNGRTILQHVGQGTLGITRGVSSKNFVVALVNFSGETDLVDLDSTFLLGERELSVLAAVRASGYKKGDKVISTDVKLPGRSMVVLGSNPLQ